MASRQKNQISTKSSEQVVKEWMTAMEEKLPANKPVPSVLEQTAFAQRLRAKLAEIGERDFVAMMNRVITECPFYQMPTWSDFESRVPVRQSRDDEPFQPPKDPVTQDQLDRLNSLVRDISEGKVMVKKAPKGQELQEFQAKGMKAKVTDSKAQAANDK